MSVSTQTPPTSRLAALTSGRTIRAIAMAEGLSFVALLISMIFKYSGPKDGTAVSISGMIHGLLFLAYVGIFLLARSRHGWSWPRTGLYLLAAFLPFAPFFVRHAERDARG